MIPADAPVSLDQLRGLHLPAETAGSAQGAVVLAMALGLAAALFVGLVRHLRARRHNSVRRAALRELATTKNLPLGARRVAQARLLRRLARTLRDEAAASTHGAAWAATLDGLFATTFFTQGAGRILVEGLYRPDPAEAPEMEAELTRLLARIGA